MQTEFRAEVRREPGAAVIALTGELDLATSPVLERELQNAFEARLEKVIVDLRQLDFMDSTGLSVIVRAHHAADQVGTRLYIARGTTQVQRLLTLTGVAQRLTIIDAPEDALQGS